jgi:hypothetical protein
MTIKTIIASVTLGFVLGVSCCQYDPQLADYLISNVIPFGIAADNLYVVLQAYFDSIQ